MAMSRTVSSTLQIHHLFNSSRLQDRAPILFLLLLVYFPVGIVLMLLRILMSFQHFIILALLPKGWLLREIILRIYLFFMGILVMAERLDVKNADIVVSNYISHLDSIILEAVLPTRRLVKHTKLPTFFKWLFGFLEDDTSCVGLECLDSDYPISFFPEEETSNGKCGLLKFNTSLFSSSVLTVLPVVISACRPAFLPVNIHCIQSTFWADVLWTLFFPCTKFHVKYLPEKKTCNGEEKEQFVKQLQADMASILNIEPTTFTAQDKLEYIKRLKHDELMKEERLFKARYTPRDVRNHTDEMAKQVKVVLPQVPINLIQVDILKSNNVDVTISNFLDGSVEFKALTEEEQQSEKEKIVRNEESATSASTATYSNQQLLSFQEKKDLMIEEARTTYLRLHPQYA